MDNTVRALPFLQKYRTRFWSKASGIAMPDYIFRAPAQFNGLELLLNV